MVGKLNGTQIRALPVIAQIRLIAHGVFTMLSGFSTCRASTIFLIVRLRWCWNRHQPAQKRQVSLTAKNVCGHVR